MGGVESALANAVLLDRMSGEMYFDSSDDDSGDEDVSVVRETYEYGYGKVEPFWGRITITPVSFPDKVCVHISRFLSGSECVRLLFLVCKRWKKYLFSNEVEWDNRIARESKMSLLKPKFTINTHHGYHSMAMKSKEVRFSLPEWWSGFSRYRTALLLKRGYCSTCFQKAVSEYKYGRYSKSHQSKQKIQLCPSCLISKAIERKIAFREYVLTNFESSSIYSFVCGDDDYFLKEELERRFPPKIVKERQRKRDLEFKKKLKQSRKVFVEQQKVFRSNMKRLPTTLLPRERVNLEVNTTQKDGHSLYNRGVTKVESRRHREKTKKAVEIAANTLNFEEEEEEETWVNEKTNQVMGSYGKRLHMIQTPDGKVSHGAGVMIEKMKKDQEVRLIIRKAIVDFVSEFSDGKFDTFEKFPRLTKKKVKEFMQSQQGYDIHSEQVFIEKSKEFAEMCERESELKKVLKEFGFNYDYCVLNDLVKKFVYENSGKTFYEVLREIWNVQREMTSRDFQKGSVYMGGGDKFKEEDHRKFTEFMKKRLFSDDPNLQFEKKERKKHMKKMYNAIKDDPAVIKYTYDNFVLKKPEKRKREDNTREDVIELDQMRRPRKIRKIQKLSPPPPPPLQLQNDGGNIPPPPLQLLQNDGNNNVQKMKMKRKKKKKKRKRKKKKSPSVLLLVDED